MRDDKDAEPSQIVTPQGRPARTVTEVHCPDCGCLCPPGSTQARQLSGGFGAVTDLCSACGHDFGELTLPLQGRT